MKQEGTTMVPLENYGPIVLAAVENRVRIDVTLIVLAGVDDDAAAAAAAATTAAPGEPHIATAAPVESYVAKA